MFQERVNKKCGVRNSRDDALDIDVEELDN